MDLGELMDENIGPGRNRQRARFDREEGVLDPDQFEFLQAVEAYQKVNGRKFLRHTEYLEIAKRLGYQKNVSKHTAISGKQSDSVGKRPTRPQ